MSNTPTSDSCERRATLGGDYVEQGVELLRDRGYKVTAQRRAILQLFENLGEHLKPADIHTRLESDLSSLSLATVYNTLELFEQEGLVARVTGQNGETYFDPNIEPHHHAICDECGDLFDVEVDGEVLGQLADSTRTIEHEETDFSIAEATIWFRGTCESCRSL